MTPEEAMAFYEADEDPDALARLPDAGALTARPRKKRGRQTVPRTIQSCNFTTPGEFLTCTAEARFRVSVGNRQVDNRFSCGMHLAKTVTALLGNEGGWNSASVTPAGRWWAGRRR